MHKVVVKNALRWAHCAAKRPSRAIYSPRRGSSACLCHTAPAISLRCITVLPINIPMAATTNGLACKTISLCSPTIPFSPRQFTIRCISALSLCATQSDHHLTSCHVDEPEKIRGINVIRSVHGSTSYPAWRYACLHDFQAKYGILNQALGFIGIEAGGWPIHSGQTSPIMNC